MSREIVRKLRSAETTYHKGWRQPEFEGWMEEQMSWKETCYIGDWSFLPGVDIEGPEALKLFSNLSVNTFNNYPVGKAKHIIFCSKKGKVISDGILLRIGENLYRAQSAPAFLAGLIAQSGAYDVTAKIVDHFIYQVSGPKSLYLLEELANENLRDSAFMHFRYLTIKGHKILALRQGMAGEVGFELQGDKEWSEEIYVAVVEAGKKYGICRVGRRTVFLNHTEACFPTAMWHYLPAQFTGEVPSDFTEYIFGNYSVAARVPSLRGSYDAERIEDYYVSPVELGWTKNIKFDHEFVGRKALEQEVANPRRTIVTLEFNSQDMIDIYGSLFEKELEPYKFMDMPYQDRCSYIADMVMKEGVMVGMSSVPAYSYYFRRVMSLCVINIDQSTPGTEVTVVWGELNKLQKKVRATVAPAPYKKDNRRIDLTTL